MTLTLPPASTVRLLATSLACALPTVLSAQFTGHDWQTDWEQMPTEQAVFLDFFEEMMEVAHYEWIGYFSTERIFTLGFDNEEVVSLPLPDGSVAVLQLNNHDESFMWGIGDSADGDSFHFTYLRTDDYEWLDIYVVPLGEFRYLASNTEPAHYLVGAYRGDFPVVIETPPDGSTPPEAGGAVGVGWRHHPDLGYYYDMSPTSWAYHPDHGWLFVSSDLLEDWESGLWLYAASGWVWSNATFYPWLWLNSSEEWSLVGQVRLDPAQWVAVTDPDVLIGHDYDSLTRRIWVQIADDSWLQVPARIWFDYDEDSQTSGFVSWFTGDEGTAYSWIMENGEMTILLREAHSTLERFAWNPGTGMVWWLGDKYVEVR